MFKIVAALMLLWSCVAAAANYVDDVGRGPKYRLYFPPFKRVETESSSGRVTAIKVTVHCGFITGISRVPGDWWVEMRGPISGETTFAASAGHGASYLWNLKTWNGSISITPYDMSCFDVTAGVLTDGPDDAKVQETLYTRKQLRLRP
jgi:hypothetical protein